MANKIKQIKKRDGRIMAFDEDKIAAAIFKALRADGSPDKKLAQKLTQEVVKNLNKNFDRIFFAVPA
jgi:transcriptional regulator NrdR family protein